MKRRRSLRGALAAIAALLLILYWMMPSPQKEPVQGIVVVRGLRPAQNISNASSALTQRAKLAVGMLTAARPNSQVIRTAQLVAAALHSNVSTALFAQQSFTARDHVEERDTMIKLGFAVIQAPENIELREGAVIPKTLVRTM